MRDHKNINGLNLQNYINGVLVMKMEMIKKKNGIQRIMTYFKQNNVLNIQFQL